jgi:D-tyrosyl-tRNA(Tyr) deacylase
MNFVILGMRLIIQRVSKASVSIDSKIVGQIQQGFLVLVGIENADQLDDANWLVQKLNGLRVFSDNEGKMNLSVKDILGNILVVSQFTLFASTVKGNRPSFIRSAKPEFAVPMYDYFVNKLKSESGLDFQTGVFGADMQIELVNDGPVTIFIDSKNKE